MDAITEHQIKQFNRWHARIFKRVGWGWDMPTLAACEPGVYNSYRRLCDMARPIRQQLAKEKQS